MTPNHPMQRTAPGFRPHLRGSRSMGVDLEGIMSITVTDSETRHFGPGVTCSESKTPPLVRATSVQLEKGHRLPSSRGESPDA